MDFSQIINKSSLLMNMEKKGEINKIHSRLKQDKTNFESTKTDILESSQPTNYSSVENVLKPTKENNIVINPNTKLPKEIVDSFRKTLIEEEKKNNEIMNLFKNNIQVNEENEIKTENRSDNNIEDKGNLKDLIKEAIREEISSLKLLSIKDKINLITNNGDVFEVKLVYKKNINNKK